MQQKIESNTLKHTFFGGWQKHEFKDKRRPPGQTRCTEAFACEAQHVHWIWCLGRNLLGQVKCISWITCWHLVCHGLSNDGFCGPADLWLFDCCFDCCLCFFCFLVVSQIHFVIYKFDSCREGKDAAWAELDVSTTWDIYGPRWGAMEKSSCIVTICLGKVTYKHSIPYHWLILALGRGLKYTTVSRVTWNPPNDSPPKRMVFGPNLPKPHLDRWI